MADLKQVRDAEEHELQALDSLSASRSGSLAGSGQEGTSRMSQAYQDGEKKQQLSTLVDNWLFTVGGLRGLLCSQTVLASGVRSCGVRGQGQGHSQHLGQRQSSTRSCTVLPEYAGGGLSVAQLGISGGRDEAAAQHARGQPGLSGCSVGAAVQSEL